MDCEGKCFLNTQIIKEVTKTAGTKSENNPENSPNFFTPHFISSNKLLISPANSFILQTKFVETAIHVNHVSVLYSPPDLLV